MLVTVVAEKCTQWLSQQSRESRHVNASGSASRSAPSWCRLAKTKLPTKMQQKQPIDRWQRCLKLIDGAICWVSCLQYCTENTSSWKKTKNERAPHAHFWDLFSGFFWMFRIVFPYNSVRNIFCKTSDHIHVMNTFDINSR